MLFGKGTAEKRALLRNDKLPKPAWGRRMAAVQQAHPEAIPAQSLCPETTETIVTDTNAYDSVLCSCAGPPLNTLLQEAGT